MGMYTEFHFNCRLKFDTPEHIINTLMFMTGQNDKQPEEHLLNHQLFKTDRWSWMLGCSSEYFDHHPNSKVYKEDWYNGGTRYTLGIRCNLKNYGSEIEKFLDWIGPYVKANPKDFLGFNRYEEATLPTLIFYKQRPRTNFRYISIVQDESTMLIEDEITFDESKVPY